jgi:hypothetical protein
MAVITEEVGIAGDTCSRMNYFPSRAEKLCFQAAQKDLRGEAIERNEAYESFSAAC